MKTLTEQVLAYTRRIAEEPEVTPEPPGFKMFNTGGVEVEVGEFLYSLVRMVKPGFVLETGTHLGISSLFLALGCKQNGKGSVWTYEVIPELQAQAMELWRDLGVSHLINSQLIPSLQAIVPQGINIDLLFLDSEPQYRFDEFIKFWDRVSPGGLILIHDLHSSLGHHGQTYHGVYDWPYGSYKPKLGKFISEHRVQVVSFPTPRGLTLFQKEGPGFEVTSHLRSGGNND